MIIPISYIKNVLFLIFCFEFINAHRECFTGKQNQLINITQSGEGPLKMSLSDPMKDFESGSYTVINKQTTSLQRYHCFNLTLLYVNPKDQYEVVGSIHDIENYQDSQGIDFSVRFSPSSSIVECLFIMSHTAKWTSTKIHYVISAREDFRVGTFIPDSVDFLPCGKSYEESIIEHRLIKEWNADENLVFAITFLGGIRTIDTELNITFGKSFFDIEKSILSLPVTFSQVQFPIEYMLISYMIVTMSSDFQITNIYDLAYIPDDINVFVGMTGIRLAPEESKGLKNAANVNNILSKNKFYEFFGVQGLVIQSSSTLDILFSDGNYSNENILECVSPEKCYAYDGYMKYYQNENNVVFHSECVLCEKYSTFNNKTKRCECRELYVRIDGVCVEKSELCDFKKRLIFDEAKQKCECMSGYELKNNECVPEPKCSEGFTLFKGNCYKITTKIPKIETKIALANISPLIPEPPKEVLKEQELCVSPAIYNQELKSCVCKNPLYYNEEAKKGESCDENEVYDKKSKSCICMDGTFRINGVCDFCSPNGFFNGTKCQCLPGYLGNGKICRKDPKFTKPPLQTSSGSDSKITINLGNEAEQSANLNKENKIVPNELTGAINLEEKK